MDLGKHWARWIPLGALLLFVLGASIPLADNDFPMHLATGAWIVQHHAVTQVEPFAWTRLGEPYYAYSWLPEVVYYLLYAHAGPIGLRALQGLTFMASGLSLLWLARVAGWKAWTALIVIFLSIFPAIFVAAFVRPQALLFPLVALAWGCGLRVLESDRPARWVLALVLVAAVAANSHLLFPMTALPCAVAVSRTPIPWKRGFLLSGALLGGWLLSPYATHYPAIFALYFGHNPLFDFPSRISEIIPGFQYAKWFPDWFIPVIPLAMTPWVLREADATPRERVVLGFLWFLGLISFGLAARALLIWWFAGLPMLARAVDRMQAPRAGAIRRMALVVMASLPIVFSLRFLALSGSLGPGIVPPARANVDPLASWLDAHVRPTGRPRVLTTFFYGSYLTWRLPEYSMSIDGRTFFPDSAAAPDAFRVADNGPFPFGPVAIIRRGHCAVALPGCVST